MNERGETKHFVLVHGFGHGAWCWYKLVALLKMNGNRVTALDLAGCGVHPKGLDDVSSISDYVQPLMDFLASLPDDEKVVLVGHSYGGIPISLAMENFPGKISLAVYLTAYMPNCTHPPATLLQEMFRRCSPTSFMDCEFTFDQAVENLPISAVIGPDFMAAKLLSKLFFGDQRYFVLQDMELAKMLIRPNSFFVEELGKKNLLSEERYGAIKRCYIICEGDEVMDEEFQKYNIEQSSPDEATSIAGAGHMAMLTKSQQLCSCLLQFSQKY